MEEMDMKYINKESKTEHGIEAEELQNFIGATVNLHGMVYKIRKMSDFAFVLIRTKRAVVQCIYSSEL